MSNKIHIVLFLLVSFNYGYSQKIDSLKKDKLSFYIEHDILGGINNVVNSYKPTSLATPTSYENFYHGGVGLSLPKKGHKLFSSDLYLNYNIYAYSVISPILTYYDYDYRVKSFGYFETFKNINLEQRLYFNKKASHKGYYLNYGLGFGNNVQKYDDVVFVKQSNWDVVFGTGYKISIKHFFVNFNVGILSTFNYKYVIDYHRAYVINTQAVFQNESVKRNDLKSVEYDGISKVTLTYKYLGILNSMFLPRVGINLGFKF